MARQQSAMSTAMTAARDATWDSRFGPEPAALSAPGGSAQPPARECSPQNQTRCSSAANDKPGSELGCLRSAFASYRNAFSGLSWGQVARHASHPLPLLRRLIGGPLLKLPFVACETAFQVPSALRSRAFRDVDLPSWSQQKQDASCLSYIANTRLSPSPSRHPIVPRTLRAFCMPFFTGPQALRLRDLAANPNSFVSMASQSYDYSNNGGVFEAFKNKAPHSSHPDFANLTLLVFEAVMEVVCVSAPGYIIARMGQFDAESQKFLANLNTQLFTPCLSEFVHAARSSAFAAAPIARALLTTAPQSSPSSPRS